MKADRSFVQKYYREMAEKKMRQKGFDPAFCGRHVRYEINGKKYCPLHAGQVALKILMETNE